MRYLWSRLIIFFLLAEGIIFICYYHYGSRGIKALQELKKIKHNAQVDIQKIEQRNADLQEQIEAWKTDLFLQEKFAREKLAMQKEHEIIYYK